jgi:hypothetical protein
MKTREGGTTKNIRILKYSFRQKHYWKRSNEVKFVYHWRSLDAVVMHHGAQFLQITINIKRVR